ESCVNRGTGCTNSCAQQISNLVKHLEVVAVLHATTTRDNDTGRRQIRTVRLGLLFTYERGQARVFNDVELRDGRRTTVRGYRIKTGRANRDHLGAVAGFNRRDGVTGIDGTNKGVGRFHADDVRYLSNVQQRSNARHEVFASGASRRQDVAVAFTHFSDQLTQVFGQEVTVGRIVRNQNLGYALCRSEEHTSELQSRENLVC